MKTVLLFLILIATCSTSCVSTKVSSKNNYDYSVLRNNSKYIIETKDGNKIRQFEFLNQTEMQLSENKKIQKFRLRKVILIKF